MSLIKGFFAKPSFLIQPIGPERAEDCEQLHAAGFHFPWSSSDFEAYLADLAIIADGAVNEATPPSRSVASSSRGFCLRTPRS